ncbi:hypothetical protein [Salisediminibacterium selenitireducens]|uniref:RNA polymerase sigma factor 70 region 1.1 domain-containing protein n=1 Tax=Bacillus selenitireducens (strain ATCC 700615 / DSM 15326 / MLS10) TaxID=439292 RepID=D6XUV0_BACIE|nr:hypothetical protein [Salisediminibacterium selenitireducens]ADH99586.1 hypothetical protein Bsel_2082 [[Bacillus] selenitireducens MLS10]
MPIDEIKQRLENEGLHEVLELIEDAERGDLEELELVKSLGLLRDEELNKQVLSILENEGVTIIYVSEEDE